MKELNFKVSVEEANTILRGLGELPFKEVYALVNKLQAQARQQEEIKGQKNGVEKEPELAIEEAVN